MQYKITQLTRHIRSTQRISQQTQLTYESQNKSKSHPRQLTTNLTLGKQVAVNAININAIIFIYLYINVIIFIYLYIKRTQRISNQGNLHPRQLAPKATCTQGNLQSMQYKITHITRYIKSTQRISQISHLHPRQLAPKATCNQCNIKLHNSRAI